LKVNNQEADKIKLKEENENLKNRLEEKDFKAEIMENKLKAYLESMIKAKDLHSQYEKSLFDMKSGFRAKEDNYKKRIEEANDLLIIKIKEQVKEFENSNSRNTKQIKKLEAQLIENKFENQNFFEKISKLEKNLAENKTVCESKLAQVEKEKIQILTEKEAEFAGFDRRLKSLTQQANSNIMKLNEDLSRMNFEVEENGKIIEFLSSEKNKFENAFLKESEKNGNLENELFKSRNKFNNFVDGKFLSNNDNENNNTNFIYYGKNISNDCYNDINKEDFSNRQMNSPHNFSEIEASNRNLNTIDKSGFLSVNAFSSNYNTQRNSKNNFFKKNYITKREATDDVKFSYDQMNISTVDYKLVEKLEKELILNFFI
jgi:hypothetical protein